MTETVAELKRRLAEAEALNDRLYQEMDRLRTEHGALHAERDNLRLELADCQQRLVEMGGITYDRHTVQVGDRVLARGFWATVDGVDKTTLTVMSDMGWRKPEDGMRTLTYDEINALQRKGTPA